MTKFDMPSVGIAYRLTFENSPEGEIECEGCPLVAEFTCDTSEPGYLTFEAECAGGSECIEFFLNAGTGEWWDENLWTRLVSLKEAL